MNLKMIWRGSAWTFKKGYHRKLNVSMAARTAVSERKQ